VETDRVVDVRVLPAFSIIKARPRMLTAASRADCSRYIQNQTCDAGPEQG